MKACEGGMAKKADDVTSPAARRPIKSRPASEQMGDVVVVQRRQVALDKCDQTRFEESGRFKAHGAQTIKGIADALRVELHPLLQGTRLKSLGNLLPWPQTQPAEGPCDIRNVLPVKPPFGDESFEGCEEAFAHSLRRS
jgi:hypothetical protein